MLKCAFWEDVSCGEQVAPITSLVYRALIFVGFAELPKYILPSQ